VRTASLADSAVFLDPDQTYDVMALTFALDWAPVDVHAALASGELPVPTSSGGRAFCWSGVELRAAASWEKTTPPEDVDRIMFLALIASRFTLAGAGGPFGWSEEDVLTRAAGDPAFAADLAAAQLAARL